MKALLLFLVSFPALAAVDGDKIGNGGGLWACINPEQEIQASTFVDFYEAQTQWRLNLINSSRAQPMEIVADIESTLREKFPDYASRWSAILADVIPRIQFVFGELVEIEDALYIIRPYPSLCRFGWKYVQFANYTNYNALLIRNDLWTSPQVSTIDKAGLIWHEVIYRWMREDFGDKNSVRTRRIVGLLFSTRSIEDSRTLLREILDLQDPPTKPQFVCLIKNNINHRYFLDFGPNEPLARSKALKTCQEADRQNSFHCDKAAMRCDSFAAERQRFTCTVKNGLHWTEFSETGRSVIEAEGKARKACQEAGDAFHCSADAVCEF